MNFAVSILAPPGYLHSEAFREVAESVHHGLTALGHDSKLTYRPSLPGRRSIVFGSNLAARSGIALPGDAILFNLEQIEAGSAWMDPALIDQFRSHPVWDYSPANLSKLSALGVRDTRHVPIGYAPALSRIPAAPEEDIDVLFVGSLNDRRRTVLDALEKQGVRLERLFGVYGAARDATLARAKICLNLHYYEAKVFEVVRVSYLLANQRFVVSERGCDAAEEAAFEGGVAFADYEKLVETCLRYLAKPEERRAIAQRGLELIRARPAAEALKPAVAALG